MISIMALITGFLMDLLFGDPYWMPHPIRFIGNGVRLLEQQIRYLLPKTEDGKRVGGILIVLIITSASFLVPHFIISECRRINLCVAFIIESFMCYQILAMKALKVESLKVYHALQINLLQSRQVLSMIVGRDTENLDEEGIIKATVETIAENTSDGVVAPMFYLALGGVPLGFLYKAVNTMDSMLGYKNEKYIDFGLAAAKLDDFANFLPSRISALLMIYSAFGLNLNWRNGFRIFKRDRYNHDSPNSAQTEAVCAGVMEIQLGGDTSYHGIVHKKKTIGDALRPVEQEDIKRANHLLYMTAVLGLLLFILFKLLYIKSGGYL